MQATDFTSVRKAFHRKMATAYHGFLTYVFLHNSDDFDLQRGLSETRNKFLSSYFIESRDAPAATWFTDKVAKRFSGSGRRYRLGDYYSEAALRILASPGPIGNQLRFEHILPKFKSIKEPCEEAFKRREPMTIEEIAGLLDERWHIAVVTSTEDKMLRTCRKLLRMPDESIFSRYLTSNGNLIFPLLRTREDAEDCKVLLGNAGNPLTTTGDLRTSGPR